MGVQENTKMRTLIPFVLFLQAQAQNSQVNQFYNITLIISEGDKIIQDSISHSQSVSNRYTILREAVYANETLQWDIESFDVMQKYLFDEIDATFEFITEQTELVVDLLYRTCWTFEPQFEKYVKETVDFCDTSYAASSLAAIDQTSRKFNQWSDTFDVWVLAFKYAI